MHEAGLMQETLDLAAAEARQAGATRIHHLRLRVGTLSGVVPEALQFAFDALTPGSPAAGATLAIEPVPATWWCEPCQAEFTPPQPDALCPRCLAVATELRRGLELELSSMEVS